MSALAPALPTPTPASNLLASMAALPAPRTAVVAGLALLAANCVAQTAELLHLACRRGQLEDASATARAALTLAAPHTPHAAMLQALAEAQPALMVAPEERRLYLLRGADGVAHGVIRLRDNGCVGLSAPAATERWTLRAGNLELSDAAGHPSARFMLCGDRAGLRLYLGDWLADGSPCMLQEVRCTHTRLSLLDPELVDPFCSLYGADAMVPTELPTGATLLLAAPHARAGHLAQALNRASGVLFDGELLHPAGIDMTESALSRSAMATLHALRAKDPAWFIRMMLSRSVDHQGRHLTGMRVRGLRMAPAHSSTALAWAMAAPGLRIVHVWRSNLLAEFADILAAQTDDPHSLLHFEAERFGRFIEMKHRDHQNLQQRLVARHADTVEVDGSRLNQATMAELLGFLTDTTDTSALACEAPPISAQRVVERFDNPEMVLPCLHALNRPSWAEAEGTMLDQD